MGSPREADAAPDVQSDHHGAGDDQGADRAVPGDDGRAGEVGLAIEVARLAD
jgi:hypothetical protein